MDFVHPSLVVETLLTFDKLSYSVLACFVFNINLPINQKKIITCTLFYFLFFISVRVRYYYHVISIIYYFVVLLFSKLPVKGVTPLEW